MDHRATTYANKAVLYARYRWDYAAEAVQTIIERAGLTSAFVVADIGAGTGILTRHLVQHAGQVYAIEPNLEMRQEAQKILASYPSCRLLCASAEETGLADHSVDLICAAQAIHWFTPEPTQREFRRILRPGGWLAIIWNTILPSPAAEAVQAISIPAYGVQLVHTAPAAHLPPEKYFAGAPFERMSWSFTYQQTWEAYLGSLCSASFMPDETHPLYPRFEQAVRAIFDQHSRGGLIDGSGETHLLIGQVRGENQ